jgi:predicted NAD-dependent protein-ADP-ribosyltransferase YbiA (DUF1768 family)
MTTAYTSLLGLALPVTGELSGTWGDTVNNSITSLLDSAIAGTQTITADTTLTTTTGAANQSRQAILLCSPASANITITAPAQSKIYMVINTSAVYTVTVRGVGPTTGVTLGVSEKAVVAWNGTDFVKISNTAGAGTFTDLTVTGNTTLGDASADTVTVNGTTTFNASPIISVTDNTNAALRITQLGTGNALLVEDSANPDATPLVVTNSGQLIVGYTAAVGAAQNTNIQSQSTGGTAGFTAFRWSNDIIPPRLQVGKSRGAAIGTNAIVQLNDQLGGVYFYGDDGTDLVSTAASIVAEVDGTPGLNDMPGRLTFNTTNDGSQVPTERVRIDSAGQTKFSYNAVVEVTDNTNAALRITQLGTGNALLVEDSANPDASPVVIDANGRVVAGATQAYTTTFNGNTFTPIVQAHAVSSNTPAVGYLAANWINTAGNSSFTFAKSRGGATGTHAIALLGDDLGVVYFMGSDGTAFIPAASITSSVDGTPGLNDMPGRLIFSTTADGGIVPTERVRITSTGKTGFATAAPAATVHVAGDTILSNVNVIGASYDSVSFSVATEELSPTDLFFSPDGLKMYIIGSTGDDVNEYNLSTAWVVSSAVFVTNFSVSGQDTIPAGLFFRADGTKMYIVGQTNDTVFQYTLSTPWSVATASYDSISFSVASQETTPAAISFKPNGLSMYVVGSTGDAVCQYTLSTAWNVSTATFLQSFSISGQETLSQGLTFTGDGSRMFVVGTTGDDVNVYNLTTPWDISTSVFVNVFSFSAQEITPAGLYIKPDGTKMYITGQTNDSVFQYTVPSIDIQLTGQTSVAALDVQQDLTVYGKLQAYSIAASGTTTLSGNQIISVTDNTNAALRITQLGTGNALLVEDSTNPDATPFVIDASGRVIQGYTTSITTADDYNGTNRTSWGIQGNNSNAAGALFTSWNASTTVGAGISLSRSKSTTVGTQGIVSSGDSLGGIGFNGDDGTNFISAAAISADVDGTPGTNDMPGRLVFGTTADGASTPTERMRIDSSGNVLVTNAAGLGYGTGAGGTVTQATSRTTGVTLSKPTGAITMFSAAGSVVAATFTVTNTLVAATDTIILNQKSGTNLYVLLVTAVAAGSFNITFYTTGGVATDAPVINFALIKGVTA